MKCLKCKTEIRLRTSDDSRGKQFKFVKTDRTCECGAGMQGLGLNEGHRRHSSPERGVWGCYPLPVLPKGPRSVPEGGELNESERNGKGNLELALWVCS